MAACAAPTLAVAAAVTDASVVGQRAWPGQQVYFEDVRSVTRGYLRCLYLELRVKARGIARLYVRELYRNSAVTLTCTSPEVLVGADQVLMGQAAAHDEAVNCELAVPFAGPSHELAHTEDEPTQANVDDRCFNALTRTLAAPCRPIRRIRNVSEQRIATLGILKLSESFASGSSGVNPPKDGAPTRMLGVRTLRRYFSKGLELRQHVDVAATQPLPSQEVASASNRATSECVAVAAASDAQDTMEPAEQEDLEILEKLGRLCFRGGSRPATLRISPWNFQALGRRLALIVGVMETDHGWKGSVALETTAGTELLPVGPCWMVPFPRVNALDSGWAIFHSSGFWLENITGEQPDLATMVAGGNINVVRDRTSGCNKDRMLDWEIATYNPQQDDVLEEVRLFSIGTSSRGTSPPNSALASRAPSRSAELIATRLEAHSDVHTESWAKPEDPSEDR